MGSTNRVCMSSSREEVSRALAAWLRAPTLAPARGTQPPLALFLCRENAASSIMAEALLRHLAKERVRAASAGDCPAAGVNPHALECLRAHGIATTGLHSKGWGAYSGAYRPQIRFLITLSEVDALKGNWNQEASRPVKANWAMPDPAAVLGSEADIGLAFEEAFGTLHTRIQSFLALPLGRLSDRALSKELTRIGEVGAT